MVIVVLVECKAKATYLVSWVTLGRCENVSLVLQDISVCFHIIEVSPSTLYVYVQA